MPQISFSKLTKDNLKEFRSNFSNDLYANIRKKPKSKNLYDSKILKTLKI